MGHSTKENEGPLCSRIKNLKKVAWEPDTRHRAPELPLAPMLRATRRSVGPTDYCVITLRTTHYMPPLPLSLGKGTTVALPGPLTW